MDLWTEFEGVTIDSAFSLNKLLQTEGRSAFFSTFNAKGESVLIRLIECHFDEDEILARWRGVQTLGHPGILRIDRFGQFRIEEDDITAVYAVFERVDANLGDVLEQGRLTVTDAAQIGVSIASALETLHTHGFVHEHVEPRNIFDVSDSVKLRGDCIRETPEGEAGFEARRRDVYDLALVLTQVLLGMPRLTHGQRQPTLPAPFQDIVRNGMSGEWGLAEIKAALAPFNAPKARPSATQGAAAAASAFLAATAKARDLAANTFTSGTAARPEPRREPPPWAGSKPAARPLSTGNEPADFELPDSASHPQHPFRHWIALGVFLAIVLLVGWISTKLLSGKRGSTVAQPAPTAGSTATPSQDPSALPSAGSSRPTSTHSAPSQSKTGWRVVAFTYNRKDQAQKKASSLALKHPDLRPEVFSPSGRAPWLVTIGGVQQRDAAYALAHKAPALGLPRDTYAQNYTVR
jgi:serine/threonine protein kinase